METRKGKKRSKRQFANLRKSRMFTLPSHSGGGGGGGGSKRDLSSMSSDSGGGKGDGHKGSAGQLMEVGGWKGKFSCGMK